MSISKKIISIFVLMLLLFWVINFFIQKSVVLPSFAEVERQHAKVNIERIEEYIQNQIDQLERINYDWSSWDDTYLFVQTNDQDYIDSNLAADTFINLQTDVALILNTQKELVWGNLFDFSDEGAEVVSTEESLKNALALFSSLAVEIDTEENSDNQVTSGVVIVENRPVVYSIRTILDSEGNGPAQGFMVFGKTLTDQILDSVQSQLKLDFQLDVIAVSEQERYVNSQYRFEYLSEDVLKIAKTYFSNGQAVFSLSTQFPRDITLSGLRSVNYALITLFVICLISAAGIALVLNMSVLKPLMNLKEWVQDVAQHEDYALRIEVQSNDEVGVISAELNNMLSIIEQKHEALEQLTLTDTLTGVPNRLALDTKLSREWNALRRDKSHLAVLVIDIDYFKLFNDNYGHQQGDVCIKTVAQTIHESLKRATDMVARFGGEEFVVVLPGLDADAASQVASLIQKSMESKRIEHELSPFNKKLTLSIGVAAVVPSVDSSVDQLIEQADAALYAAKDSGRNCIKVA